MKLKKTFCRNCHRTYSAARVIVKRDHKDCLSKHAAPWCPACYRKYHAPKNPIDKFLQSSSPKFSLHNISSLFKA